MHSKMKSGPGNGGTSQLFGRWKQEDHELEACLGKVIQTLSHKQNKNKIAGGMAQSVEYLLSMRAALGSILGTRKKRKRVWNKKELHW
jgi:hypothetical protein